MSGPSTPWQMFQQRAGHIQLTKSSFKPSQPQPAFYENATNFAEPDEESVLVHISRHFEPILVPDGLSGEFISPPVSERGPGSIQGLSRDLHQIEDAELESIIDEALHELMYWCQPQVNSSDVLPLTGAITQPPPPGTSTPSISGSQSHPPVYAASMHNQGSQQIFQGAGARLDFLPLYQAISDCLFTNITTSAILQPAVTSSIIVATHPTTTTSALPPTPPPTIAPPVAHLSPPSASSQGYLTGLSTGPMPTLAQWSMSVLQNQDTYLLPALPYSEEAQPEEMAITVTEVGETLGYP
ncbi:hypothetical protein DFP72DRAFT_841681 [Ephemerocybe angulata]|uniref:Uncharacterized protein n=1 Tax=Ephemerocybe angulata TaxID=980116 RepID=A0A8H6IBL4_9AGAR|nr:hypothetical protein DFP72DRAFT_841681 [Tulosesus angulatus]